MIDTHAHLNLPPLLEDATNVLQRAQLNGVTTLIIVGTDMHSSQIAIELTTTLDHTYASVGIHPDEGSDHLLQDPEAFEHLVTLASHPNVVAIGECGLDYVSIQSMERTQANQVKTIQKRLFGLHIQASKQLHKPLIIHVRNTHIQTQIPTAHHAYADTLDTIRHYSTNDGVFPRFVLHCMSGNQSYLEQALAMGAFISFAGNVTYKSAQSLRDLLHATPLDRLLIETDSPFLAPNSHRGKPCEPSFIAETLSFIATELKMDLQTLDQLTTENAQRFFMIE